MSTYDDGSSSVAGLEAEIDRLATVAGRRWAWRASPGAAAILLGLLLGATTTTTAAGPGLGARTGGFLGWLGLVVVVGALARVRLDLDPSQRSGTAITALAASAVVALSVRSAVTAEQATPWPSVVLLGAAWVAGTAGAELLRQRQLLAAGEPGAMPSARQLGALRRRVRDASARDAADPT
ncbi:hypothetical protein BH10ACT1_BH10ACT1_37790 [soil metagenome]